MIGPLRNDRYDRLRFVAEILLPLLGVLYFALDLPSAKEVVVVGTILVLDLILGVFLRLSRNAYNSTQKYAGTIHVGGDSDDGIMQNFRMELPLDAAAVASKKEITLKVKQPERGRDMDPHGLH